ncbi:hypothetical protein B0H16DRAFT_1463607 [Mycena metata]|uniref:Uncharacterized protein n=1 Tax=Mycena metata TaxID=1033252 RepID=A0AAD7N452_9AGAR|nr:hypothetical protein B0H16DRAFT_1463607 [Mycena metata]
MHAKCYEVAVLSAEAGSSVNFETGRKILQVGMKTPKRPIAPSVVRAQPLQHGNDRVRRGGIGESEGRMSPRPESNRARPRELLSETQLKLGGCIPNAKGSLFWRINSEVNTSKWSIVFAQKRTNIQVSVKLQKKLIWLCQNTQYVHSWGIINRVVRREARASSSLHRKTPPGNRVGPRKVTRIVRMQTAFYGEAWLSVEREGVCTNMLKARNIPDAVVMPLILSMRQGQVFSSLYSLANVLLYNQLHYGSETTLELGVWIEVSKG